MTSETIGTILKIFAPSVSDKISSYLMGKKVSFQELNVVLIALTAEQNLRTGELLELTNKNTESLIRCMNRMEENVAVLLKRTEKT